LEQGHFSLSSELQLGASRKVGHIPVIVRRGKQLAGTSYIHDKKKKNCYSIRDYLGYVLSRFFLAREVSDNVTYRYKSY
jgi:hypothetical protein